MISNPCAKVENQNDIEKWKSRGVVRSRIQYSGIIRIYRSGDTCEGRDDLLLDQLLEEGGHRDLYFIGSTRQELGTYVRVED